MKTIIIILLSFMGISAIAQDNAQLKFAILRTDYREGTFKVYLENGLIENLADTLKIDKYLDKAGPAAAKAQGDRILFKCREYLDAKGYELITYSMFPTDGATVTNTLTALTENKNFYREYIFRLRRK